MCVWSAKTPAPLTRVMVRELHWGGRTLYIRDISSNLIETAGNKNIIINQIESNRIGGHDEGKTTTYMHGR